MTTLLQALNASREAQRTSEVARVATDLQRSTGCTRTEALRTAEQAVPHDFTHVHQSTRLEAPL